MNPTMPPIANRPAWKSLELHAESMRNVHLRTLFANDPVRGERLTTEAVGLFLDYSKNRVSDETIALLLSDHARRGQMAAAAHHRATTLTWDATALGTLTVLHGVMTRGHSA